MTRHRIGRPRGPLLLVALLGASLVVGVAVTTVPGGGSTASAPASFHHPRPRPTHTRTPAPTPTTPAPTTTTAAPTTTAPPVTPTAPATAPATSPAPPQVGWIAVDPAKQAADTAAFFARTPRPLPADNPRTASEFHALCKTFHRNDDDPIVFPGLAGASHNHTFWGNSTTNADSTLTSLENGVSTCDPTEDKSAYWIPTVLVNGQPALPKEVTVYYGTNLTDYARVQPFPKGLRMIVGDAKRQTGTENSGFFCAGGEGQTGRTADDMFPICGAGADLVRYILFPECWDGKHLDSPDHKAHMAFGIGGGVCPADHPVQVPTVVYTLVFGPEVAQQAAAITLASGNTHSIHADFFNAWDEEALAQRVRDCIDQHAKCDAQGEF
ncbi:MAG TPA: DUF1996 domain-containing protein [Mycobacteriales bacterium]